MKNTVYIFLLLFAILSVAKAQQVVKVGAFNFYPAIFQDTDGVVKGFYVDALNELGREENLKFIYIYGSWDEGLERIKTGEVDVLTSVAVTEERLLYMNYTATPLLTVWSEVYVNPKSEIKGILDLEGKKIAVMRSDFNGRYFQQLTEKLNVKCEFVETTDFEEVFKLISKKAVDAGVVNNTFGAPKSDEYGLLSSGIIFNPFDIFFTVKKGSNEALLKILNTYLHNWQYDRNSVFNTSRQKWTHGNVGAIKVFPAWLQKAIYISLFLFILLIAFVVLLRYRVRVVTEKVKYSELLFKTFMENTPGYVYIKDDKLNHIYRNMMVDKVNKTARNDINSSARTVFEPQIAELVEKADKEILSLEKAQLSLQYHCKLNGEHVWLHDYKFYLRLPNGKPAIGGISFDITGLKDTERDLIIAKEKAEESEEKYKLLHENAGIGIGYYSPEAIVISFNQVAAKHMNGIPEDFIGKSIFDLFPKPIADFYFNRFQKAIQSTEPTVYEDFIQLPDDEKWFLSTYTKIVDSQGKVFGIQIISLDITQLKTIEIELQIAKEKAEESDRLKSAFLANMSHEIRTPMNGILGFAELLNEPDLTGAEQQKCIDMIGKSGKRMLNIINDIMDISKIESGLMEPYIKEAKINEQTEYIYTFFKPEVDAKGLKFSFNNSLPEQDAIIRTDREKLYAILTNLVKNAIKYTKEGSVEFGYTLKRDNETKVLEFYVKDTGIGIPKDRQDAIFERFIQADIADKMAYQGAGLGLAITKAFVELLGGRIWVESEEGIGSIFYFTLPYSTITTVVNTSERDILLSGNNDNPRKLKILIAEDDEVSEMVIDSFIKLFSKEVLKAQTGLEAVNVCRENPDLDLILMDIRMPEMNGYEATQQIRQFNKEVVIIAQTAFGLAGDRQKSIESGCNDYITKPISKADLKAMVQKHFGN